MQPGPTSVWPGLRLVLDINTARVGTPYNKEGLRSSETARVIDPGTATFRFREDRHQALRSVVLGNGAHMEITA